MDSIRTASEPESGTAPPSEPHPPVTPLGRTHYGQVVFGTLGEANQHGEIGQYVDVLCECLGWILCNRNDVECFADVVQRLGGHTVAYLDRKRAEEELQALRDTGGSPN